MSEPIKLERRPFRPISPGEILQEEISARGPIQGLPEEVINEILTGERPITAGIAEVISQSLRTSPEYWLNLEEAYQKDRAAFPIKLEIGAGTIPRPGYVHCDMRELPDIEIIAPCFDLPLDDGSVAEIWSADCFEHLSYAEARRALREWHRVLIPGGLLRFTCPDLYRWAKFLIEAEESHNLQTACGWTWEWIMTAFYGWQQHEHDFHRAGWTEKALKREMEAAEFEGVRLFQRWWYNGPEDAHLCMEAHKPGGEKKTLPPTHLDVPRRLEEKEDKEGGEAPCVS